MLAAWFSIISSSHLLYVCGCGCMHEFFRILQSVIYNLNFPSWSLLALQETPTDGDPELLDDSEFYQQLLKEFFETVDPSSSGRQFHFF